MITLVWIGCSYECVSLEWTREPIIFNFQNCIMIVIPIKPLSVNEAWKGTRIKTDAYRRYERDVLMLLPRFDIFPAAPYKIDIYYGFSNKGSDIDNPTKMILDILQKKYLFNDSHVYDLHLHKTIVEKGKEYTKINISSINV